MSIASLGDEEEEEEEGESGGEGGSEGESKEESGGDEEEGTAVPVTEVMCLSKSPLITILFRGSPCYT